MKICLCSADTSQVRIDKEVAKLFDFVIEKPLKDTVLKGILKSVLL